MMLMMKVMMMMTLALMMPCDVGGHDDDGRDVGGHDDDGHDVGGHDGDYDGGATAAATPRWPQKTRQRQRHARGSDSATPEAYY